MNKEDIIQALSSYLFDRKQAKTAVEATLSIIKTALKKGDKVVLSNFGTFKTKESNPITLKNPKTKKEMTFEIEPKGEGFALDKSQKIH